MARQKENRVKFGNTLDSEMYVKLNDLSKQTKIPISRLLDEAIQLLIQKYKQLNMYKEKE